MARIRVLVPLDGSTLAETALSHLPILQSLGALHLRMVSVAEDVHEYGMPDAEAFQDREANLLRNYLEAQKHCLQQRGELDLSEIEAGVRRGNAPQLLLEEVKQFQPDYLVLATHGRAGLKRLRIGSIATFLLQRGNVNTLLIGPLTATWPVKNRVTSVLVPLDGSEHAEQALPVATEISRGLGARLHLVRVLEPHFPIPDKTGLSSTARQESAQLYLNARLEAVQDLEATATVKQGVPGECLASYVHKHAIGVVVLTSHRRKGLPRVALGSVAETLVRCEAPVLIVQATQEPGIGQQGLR